MRNKSLLLGNVSLHVSAVKSTKDVHSERSKKRVVEPHRDDDDDVVVVDKDVNVRRLLFVTAWGNLIPMAMTGSNRTYVVHATE